MTPTTWRYVALCGPALAAAAAVVGHGALRVAFALACLAAVVAIATGIRKYRPRRPGPWFGLAGAATFFLAAQALRILHPEFSASASSEASGPAYMEALAYFAAIMGIHRLGQVRDRHKDPTTVIDSLIVAGGASTIMWVFGVVPYLNDVSLHPTTRVLGVLLAILSTWLAFGATRLAIAPGVRTTAGRLLLAAALAAVVAETVTTASADSLSAGVLVFGTIAGFFLSAAALHPDMPGLTEPGTRRVATMTRARLTSMTVAMLIAPAVIASRLYQSDGDILIFSGLLASWALVTALVMVRLAGLVRARERVAQVDRALRRGAASLVAAPDLDATYASAVGAMAAVAGDAASDLRASVALAASGWAVVDSHGIGAANARGYVVDADALDGLLRSRRIEAIRLSGTHSVDVPTPEPGFVVAMPLLAHGVTRGVILVTTAAPLPTLVVEALEALATDVALAVEAASLAEDLHRRRSERRLSALIQHSNDLTAVLDTSGTVTYVSPSVQRILGYPAADITGTPITSIVHPGDADVVGELAGLLGAGTSVSNTAELRVRHAEGRWLVFDITLTNATHDESVGGLVMNAHDITQRKALEEDLRQKVFRDDLTGIANRVLFRDRLEHALRMRRGRSTGVTAAIAIDLDDFKAVNDALGHDVGDELLKIVAFRLESFLRSGDTAARLGGDEFGVLIEGSRTVEDVMHTAGRLLAVIAEPIDFAERSFTITASLGVAVGSDDVTPDVLLRNADVAMHHAKQSGKGRAKLFTQEMYLRTFERLELKADLAQALDRGEISLHYQPLVDMATRDIVGFEALMRWAHPIRGMVSPASFIPLAEETGTIVTLGAWALQEACRQLAEWRIASGRDFHMSVNLSARQLQEAGVVADVSIAIEQSGIDASWLTIELTESAGLDEGTTRERLMALRGLGCQIAADDFGTGFATYAALQQLPFTNVKIDRSLINGLSSSDPRAHAQVRSIIEMGRALGLSITAEGIEDEAQAEALSAMGANKGQGYLFGRPMAHGDVAALLAEELRHV